MGKSSFFKTMQVDQDSGELGVISDQWVTLGRPSNEKVVPLVKARLIEFYDSSQDRCALICDLLVKVVMKQLSRLKSVKWS